MHRSAPLAMLALVACNGPSPDDSGDTSTTDSTVDWSGTMPDLSTEVTSTRGMRHARAVVHLHSPYSHDACDGDGYVDGEIDVECLADLRTALCATRNDVAFATDHPDYGAFQTFEGLLHHQDGDELVEVDGKPVANRIACDNGHRPLYVGGFEDIVMPVGFSAHVAGDDQPENSRLLNKADAESFDAEHAVGGVILQNHTEGESLTTLLARQSLGLDGVETFNLHAMFAPDIRTEAFGWEAFGWTQDIRPFTDNDATGEPDLYFLGVHGRQDVSIERWVALNQVAPTISVAGTDAHQNVMPLDLRDGERADSYRRMLMWFSNTLLVEEGDHTVYVEALRAGRSYISYQALGVPDGFDFHAVGSDGGITELGGTAPSGSTLNVTCPVLSAGSPQGTETPEIAISVLKDGEAWQSDCGSFSSVEDGVYHVEVSIVPHHLRPFLGEEPEPYLRPFPWIQSNAIRVGLTP